MPRIEAGAVGREARMLPLSYVAPPRANFKTTTMKACDEKVLVFEVDQKRNATNESKAFISFSQFFPVLMKKCSWTEIGSFSEAAKN